MVLGNAITSRSDGAPGQEHGDPVEAEREAAVRRRAGREAIEQKPEPPPDLGLGDAEQLEDAPLHGRIGDPDRAAAQLVAIVDRVVVQRADPAGLGVEPVQIGRMRRRERMVGGDLPPALRVELEEREVHDPGERVLGERLGPRSAGERGAHGVQRGRRGRVGPGDGQQQVTLGTPHGVEQRLADGLHPLPLPARAGAPGPDQPAGPGLLRGGREAVDVLSGQRRTARSDDRAQAPARRAGLCQEWRRIGAQVRGEIADLPAVAQIGLVDPEALHRVAPGQPGERTRDLDAALVPQVDQDALDHLLDVFGAHERGLEVDLSELGLPVGPQIFVAEAARDLEVAVVPRHHQQLLVDLGRLRQRVELPAVDSARNQVVAGAFGRRFGEDRRLDLEEVEIGERAARPLQEPVAEDQVLLQLRATEVEHAVLEAELLGRQLLLLLAGHRNARGLRGARDLEIGDVDLDLPRAQALVAGRLGSECHLAGHQHDGLGPRRCGPRHHLGRRPVGVARELHQSRAVAQVDEHKSAQVPPTVDPAAEPHLLAHVGAGELAGPVGAQRRGAHAARGGPGKRHVVNALRRRGGRCRTHRQWQPRAVADAPSPGAPGGRSD